MQTPMVLKFKSNANTSYDGGLVAKINLLKGISVQPELLYFTQGATYKTAAKEFKNEMGYITIPVMLKIPLLPSLSFELDPQAGSLLREKNKFDANKASTLDFNANAGLGLKITNNLFANRYGMDLTEIKTDSKIKNAVFQLLFGILL